MEDLPFGDELVELDSVFSSPIPLSDDSDNLSDSLLSMIVDFRLQIEVD